MTQAWYNIVVVGTDLTGLIYAALAARLPRPPTRNDGG